MTGIKYRPLHRYSNIFNITNFNLINSLIYFETKYYWKIIYRISNSECIKSHN